MEIAEYTFKIIICGPSAVGKSSLIRRFVDNAFSTDYQFTLGVDFMSKLVEYEKTKFARLSIWDIGGQDRFQVMRRNFYKGTQGALLVFDLSREQTFYTMQDWLSDLHQTIKKDVPIIIIGNKKDIISEIGYVIDREMIRKFINNININLIETSAKTGENVTKAFVQLTRLIIINTYKPEIGNLKRIY
ncbi:MAG: Rab family GTPase [Candidatus Hodarchaeota archaeon]